METVRRFDWTKHAGRPFAMMVGVFFCVLFLLEPATLQFARERIFDLYQKLHPREPGDGRVTVVEIDADSLRLDGAWPWPRTKMATLIDRLASADPRMIGVDIIFSEPDRYSPENALPEWNVDDPDLEKAIREWLTRRPSNDRILAESLNLAPPSVVGTLGIDPEDEAKDTAEAQADADMPVSVLATTLEKHVTIIPILPDIAASGTSLAPTNIKADSDGIVRRVSLLFWIEGGVRSSFALESLRLGLGAPGLELAGNESGLTAIRLAPLDVVIETEGNGTIRPHFSRLEENSKALASGRIPRALKATGVLQSQSMENSLRQRWILVGLSDPNLANSWSTPLGERIPDVMLQAEILENLIEGSWLSRPDWLRWLEAAATLGVILVLIAVVPGLGMTRIIGLATLMTTAIPLGGFLLFIERKLLMDGVFPTIAGLVILVILAGAGHTRSAPDQSLPKAGRL